MRRGRAGGDEAQLRRLPGAGARAHPEGGGVVKQHVVLIGLPGAGKTTVGRLVAEQLHAGFVDVDTILVRKEGKPIAMIFAEKGEVAFRELERRETDAVLASEPAIITPGGGWAAQAGALESAKPRAFVVYLKTKADTAAGRATPEGTRPMLMGEDPVARMRNLLKERAEFYEKAHAQVDTERKAAAQVADEVVRLAQTRAGW
ncbi:MAG: shikimate kinase [Gemmatimonadetes bacterium]|nr:MAG: shikimate kinase [Gemmatimonadota bacterium]